MTATSRASAHRATLALMLVLCAGYLLFMGPRDWIPHDDGAMAHAAERVLAGEVPHRDFNEPYTGGLSYIHAAAFRIFGVDLLALRWMLGIFALGFLAALYRLAAPVAAPPVAAAVTLLAFVWSLPNYFVPLPSWYNLFFATFGTLALFRYIEDPRPRWLAVAGAMGAFSVLCKIVGLYYFAAVLLALVYFQWCGIGTRARSGRGGAPFVVLSIAGLVAFVGSVVVLVSNRWTSLSFLLFVAPSAAVAGVVIGRVLARRRSEARGSVPDLFSNIGVLAASALAVLALYLGVHLATSSLDALWDGTVSVVLRRLDYTGAPLPPLWSAGFSLPFLALFGYGTVAKRVREPWLAVAAVTLLSGAVVLYGANGLVYLSVWYGVRPLVPILVLAAVWRLVRPMEEKAAARLFVLASMASLLSLVQFPFSGGIYFCYVAPILAVLGLHLVQAMPAAPRRLIATVATGLAAFALLWFHTGSTYLLGYAYQHIGASSKLDLPRGGIRVRERDALFYRELVDRIEAHTSPGEAIYASPDMPEVYFLAARPNATRTFFDSTDADYLDPQARDARIMRELAAQDVAFAVLGKRSEFSRAPSKALQDFLAERLPQEERMAGYLLRWRQAEPGSRVPRSPTLDRTE